MSAIQHPSPASRPKKYDALTRALHWIFAAIILYTMVAGISLHFITNRALFNFLSTLNMSLASCLILLFPVRYLWSFFRKEPQKIKTIPRVQHAMAHVVHSMIYALTAFVLVSGFVMVPDGYSLFGLVHIPTPYGEGPITDHWFDLHKFGCYALLLLVVLHIAAALKHHFALRNGVLNKML
ncbi:cytochrome b [Dyella subtropica]|uniref:cytochrome b n=1 Tax=Dyella subtropica TaxID=2992127 RepID=UPI00224E5424|nr:cytochrome b/b6 domain-containing protein [Dyella subtropica]